MKKKKYLAFFLVAVSLMLLFTACNKGKYGEDTKTKSEEITRSLVQALAEGDYAKYSGRDCLKEKASSEK